MSDESSAMSDELIFQPLLILRARRTKSTLAGTMYEISEKWNAAG